MTETEKIVWDFLIAKTNNPYGTAAIMGNLMAESSMNPHNATGSKDMNYISKADSGDIDFEHDGVAFGIAQWCYHTRKAGLLAYSKEVGKSVGDLHVQLEYLWKELPSYKTVYNGIMNAADIRTASDIFMLKYERPSNTSETMKKRRADYAQEYFNEFVKEDPSMHGKKYVTAEANVNIRSGDSRLYPVVGKIMKGGKFEFVTVSPVTGWYAIRQTTRIGWVSNEFTKVV